MVLVNSPGSRADTYAPLLHAAWNGWTLADTIFPFFLWIVGMALTLSTAARLARGAGRASLLRHAVRRSLLLFSCGLFLDVIIFPHRGFPYLAFRDHLQVSGVLQKIAVCYLVSFLMFLWTDFRGVIASIVTLNLVYLWLLFRYPVPGCGAGVLTVDCNFPGYLDRVVLSGHLWGDASAQDPDGLGAILPAISTVLLGVLAGYVLRVALSPMHRILRLLGMGLAWIVSGSLLSIWIPINKPLWTTSYALLMAGVASVCFAICYWLVDVRQAGRWLKPLEIFGMNAVAAYVVSRLVANVPRVHFFGKSFYTDVCRQLVNPPNASLLYAVTVLVCVYSVAWFMYRQRWFLKF